MKNTTHRVVILNNVNSEVISQAILILKDNARVADTNVILEAERIVEGYMGYRINPEPQKKQHHIAGLMSCGAAIAGLVLAAVIYFV